MKKNIGLMIFGVLACSILFVEFDGVFAGKDNDTKLTVYNSNLALVRESRVMELEEGVNEVRYDDVPSEIIPSSVLVKGASVLEQSYEYDVLSRSKMLEKYIDREIEIVVSEGDSVKKISGVLLSSMGDVILEIDGGVETFSSQSLLSFRLADRAGLLTKPTLLWSLIPEEAGDVELNTSYLTRGFSWESDYVMDLEKGMMSMKGWATVKNNTNVSFEGVNLDLVAGDVNQVRNVNPNVRYKTMQMEAVSDNASNGFSESNLSEYHMYSLGRGIDLKSYSSKQISLMEIEGVEVDKRFVYVGGEKANVVLRFNNSDGALPKGVVRVYEDGEFVGEDRIDHTPIDEEVDVKIGQAFDIRIEKRVSDSKVGGSKLLGSKCNSSSYEVLIKNHKDVDVVVYVKETPYGRDIEVSDYNFDLEKISENEYEFEVPVEADGESDLEYVVTTCY